MAEQIQRLDGRGSLRVEVLTGNTKGKARQKLLEEVGNGEVGRVAFLSSVLLKGTRKFRSAMPSYDVVSDRRVPISGIRDINPC